MPIYAYRCESCGHEKDVLRKLSDAPLTQCPACGKDTFSKQVTAAGFQLKGSGWYVTDFRGGNNANGNSNGNSNANGGAGASNAASAKSDGGASGSDNSANSTSGDSAAPASVSSSDAPKPASGASAAPSA